MRIMYNDACGDASEWSGLWTEVKCIHNFSKSRSQKSHFDSLPLTHVQALETVPFAFPPQRFFFSRHNWPKDSAAFRCPTEFEAQLPIQTSHSCTPGSKPYALTLCHLKTKLSPLAKVLSRISESLYTQYVVNAQLFYLVRLDVSSRLIIQFQQSLSFSSF